MLLSRTTAAGSRAVHLARAATASAASLSPALLSSVRTKFSKPDIHVYLKEDVQGLGKRGEIVLADLSAARNYLVPFKLAYYVPRFRGRALLPRDWKPKLSDKDLGIESITPAFASAEYEGSASPQTVRAPSAPSLILSAAAQAQARSEMTPEQRAASDAQRRATLAEIGKITFERVRISADSDKIFGSVSAYDIALEVERLHSVQLERDMIFVDHQKIKTLGSHPVEIRFHSNTQPIKLEVIVQDLSE